MDVSENRESDLIYAFLYMFYSLYHITHTPQTSFRIRSSFFVTRLASLGHACLRSSHSVQICKVICF